MFDTKMLIGEEFVGGAETAERVLRIRDGVLGA